jgi:hypothetical protein
MSREMTGGAVLATSLWALIAWALVFDGAPPPRDVVWVSSRSDRVASRPALVRASALPFQAVGEPASLRRGAP